MNILNKKAFSVIEYAILFVIIIGALLLMRNYIQRGVYGTWQQSGQSFAFGRQYDSQKTIECAFDGQSNIWYDSNCLESLSSQQCYAGNPENSVAACKENIITSGSCAASGCSQTQTPAACSGNSCPGANTNPGTNCTPVQGTLSAWSACPAYCAPTTQTRTCDGASCGGNCNGAALTQPCTNIPPPQSTDTPISNGTGYVYSTWQCAPGGNSANCYTNGILNCGYQGPAPNYPQACQTNWCYCNAGYEAQAGGGCVACGCNCSFPATNTPGC